MTITLVIRNYKRYNFKIELLRIADSYRDLIIIVSIVKLPVIYVLCGAYLGFY